MKLRPTIFLSSVSSEFASFRDAAEIEIKKKGCFPLNEPSFPVDYSEIEELLRRHLSEADAMIQIVGFRYGSEPKGRPGNRPRRSYTQMEYDIARELNIPVMFSSPRMQTCVMRIRVSSRKMMKLFSYNLPTVNFPKLQTAFVIHLTTRPTYAHWWLGFRF